jgi:hypothetical protein
MADEARLCTRDKDLHKSYSMTFETISISHMLIYSMFPYSDEIHWILTTLQFATNTCGNLSPPAISVGEHRPGGTWGDDTVTCTHSERNPLGETLQWVMRALL